MNDRIYKYPKYGRFIWSNNIIINDIFIDILLTSSILSEDYWLRMWKMLDFFCLINEDWKHCLIYDWILSCKTFAFEILDHFVTCCNYILRERLNIFKAIAKPYWRKMWQLLMAHTLANMKSNENPKRWYSTYILCFKILIL